MTNAASAGRPAAVENARRTAFRGLRRAVQKSPAPVQRALSGASVRVLDSLGTPVPAPPPAPATGAPVWVPPPLPHPDGVSVESIEKTFRSWSIGGEPEGHMNDYVTDSFHRFLHTWSLVRDEHGTALELGANPYFTTYLLDRYTGLELTLANYFGHNGTIEEKVSFLPDGESERVEQVRTSEMFNVEEDPFPYGDDSLDVVLFCEMLEHLLMDPTATLREIQRILKPNGVLVLTTPNVARIINVLTLVNGANMYDPYSGYGPYGRHNREYTRHELHLLLEFLGFEVETSFTADGHPVHAESWPKYDEVAPLIEYRKNDLGHYLFVKARKVRPPREGLPNFLFRSYPAGVIVDV
ncbi:class I SAM-dependent methyltransferase [Jatrophihabitans sp. YIM 134969]